MKKFFIHCPSKIRDACLLGIAAFFLLLQILPVLNNPGSGAWGIWHYYLGAKYLNEVGYFDLYNCVVATQSTPLATPVRNLSNYQFSASSQLPPCPKSRFSTATWQQFQQDSQQLIQRGGGRDFLQRVLQDKGFNPPPSWVAIAGPLAKLVPLNHGLLSGMLFNLDILFILATGVIVWHCSGRVAGLLTLILALGYFGSFGILGNNFLQYAWLPLIAGAVSAWRYQRPLLSGSLLGGATALQVFPGLFALAIALQLAIALCQKRWPLAKFTSFFLAAFLSMLALGFILGANYGKGLSIWQEWSEKIAIHKTYLQGEVFDIGLPTLLGTATVNHRSQAQNYLEDYAPSQARQQAFQAHALLYHTIFALVILAVIISLWRNPGREPFAYGYILLFTGMSLSPYYYLILALTPFIFWKNPPKIRQFVILSIVLIFIGNAWLFWRSNYVSFSEPLHLLSQLSLLIFFICLLSILLLDKDKR